MAEGAGTEVPPDENKGGQILAICGVLVAVCLVIVMLRIWVRARIIRQVGADDWTMIAAMVCSDMHLRSEIREGDDRWADAVRCLRNRWCSLSR
jgi:hypothetical protein